MSRTPSSSIRGVLAAALFGSGLFLSVACGSSATTATAPSTASRCGVAVSATDATVPASGGSGRLSVTTARECAWTAASTAAWLTINGPSSGQGDGSIDYIAAANADPVMRKGVIELNDQRAEVTQSAADCTLSLRDTFASFSPAGGSGTVEVHASSAMCTWTASSEASWITIKSGTSGSGNGAVSFDVAAASAPRSGIILVAGLRFAVTQSEGCAYAIAPSTLATGAAGGGGTVAVATTAGCPWTAASNVDWISIVQGASGTGPGTTQLAVSATSGPGRTGSALIAGQLLSVTQAGSCSYSISPESQSVPGEGGEVTVAVSAPAGCTWTASSNDSWVAVASGASGVGGGSVRLAVAATTSGVRSGTVTIAGRTFTINQGSACSFSIAPVSATVPASGGAATIAVTAGTGCAWTASTSASWITVTSGASGTGNGTVELSVAATTSGPRSATLTVAGQVFTVNQTNGCSFGIAPTSASFNGSGGTGTIAVTAGADCGWAASSNVPWITITSGASGTGNGSVQYSVAATTSGPRSATITVAGQTFTVDQSSGCTSTIAPSSVVVAAAGGSGTVSVTVGDGCAWSSSSLADWITVTSGSTGIGSGSVQLSFAANFGGARTGTVTIAGQTFTADQAASSCTYKLSPTSRAASGSGESASFNVNTDPSCIWTATSTVSWITVKTDGAATGSGKVDYEVLKNPSATERTGTIVVMGQIFTVTQGGS
jgi:hypothetical protein